MSKKHNTKMDPKIKKMWIEALLSDEYDQNFDVIDNYGALRTESNTWSAFGVLCNLHAQANPDIASKQTKKTEYMDYEFLLPYDVKVWAGFDKNMPFFLPFKKPIEIDGFQYKNIDVMCIDGVPFFIIADVIDEMF